jgi:hypothetical protein
LPWPETLFRCFPAISQPLNVKLHRLPSGYDRAVPSPQQLAALALLTACAIAGCSQEDESELPDACTAGADAVRSALLAAPAPVRVEGTPISACLTRSSEASDVQQVGAAYVSVASGLAAKAAARPESDEALRLGYLIGAVRRGAGQTAGIHSELLRRLEQEVGALDAGSGAFRRGERSGRASG